MIFCNLVAEMARRGLNTKQLSIMTNIGYKTMQGKLKGKTDFTRGEMIAIRDLIFPKLSLDYLFGNAIHPTPAPGLEKEEHTNERHHDF